MASIFYIGKRTLFDILHTGIFWVTVALAGFLVFAVLWWGWHSIEAETSKISYVTNNTETGENQSTEWDAETEWNPIENLEPETIILWYVYTITIGIANLLSIFIMMGLIGREIELRTIDLLISRPVTRVQAFIGKLLAGWASIAFFLLLMILWTMICQVWGGMGAQPSYISACSIGILSPFLVGAITLVFTIWLRGFLAGLLGTVILFASGTVGMTMIKIIGVEVLKMQWPVRMLYKILPPLNVIGQHATDKLADDVWFRFARMAFMEFGPTVEDGLYTEMWHVFVYLGIVLTLGLLSFFRKQFN